MDRNINTVTAMINNIARTFALIATVLTIGQSYAAKPVKVHGSTTSTRTMERELDRALNRHLTYPLLSRENMNGEVFVSFVIDKEGKVEVVDCKSTNDELKEYVMRKLSKIDIGDNPDGFWKTTHMRISFRPEHI